MPFKTEWCCKNAEIWDEEEEGAPCHICPMQHFEPDPYNVYCLERWKYLDIFGRDRAFSEMPLREEAIDAHLNRYHANTQDIYETVCKIELKLFSDRQDKEKKKKEAEERKRKAESKAKSTGPGKAMVPRRTATLR